MTSARPTWLVLLLAVAGGCGSGTSAPRETRPGDGGTAASDGAVPAGLPDAIAALPGDGALEIASADAGGRDGTVEAGSADASAPDAPRTTDGGAEDAAGARLTVDRLAAVVANHAGCATPGRTLFSVSNTGGRATGPITASIAAPFMLGADGCQRHTLAPGASCMVEVLFNSLVGGEFERALDFEADPGGHATTRLRGLAPYRYTPAPTPGSFEFGEVDIGKTSAPKTTTLTNTGLDPWIIDAVLIPPDDFVITQDTCNHAELAAGASCQVTFVFRPVNNGERVAHLMIQTDDRCGGSAAVVTVQGVARLRVLPDAAATDH
jgi:hypothetical protein